MYLNMKRYIQFYPVSHSIPWDDQLWLQNRTMLGFDESTYPQQLGAKVTVTYELFLDSSEMIGIAAKSRDPKGLRSGLVISSLY